MVYDIAFDQYTNGPALQRVTHADAPHDLIGLVNFPGTEVPVDGPIGVQNWSWLGPALLDGLRDAPDVFAEKIANLIAAGRQSPDDPKVHTYPVVPENLKSLFNEHSQEVINRLVRQRDRASDHIQKTIDQIVKSTQESVS